MARGSRHAESQGEGHRMGILRLLPAKPPHRIGAALAGMHTLSLGLWVPSPLKDSIMEIIKSLG